jgi:hypothetical protein
MSEELNPKEARAGVVSGRVRTILITSLSLAAVAFVVVYGWFILAT